MRKQKRCRCHSLYFQNEMNNPWILCGTGVLFCCAGIFLFFKNVYEEGKSIKWPVFIMIMGVLLITTGTAKWFKLIDWL